MNDTQPRESLSEESLVARVADEFLERQNRGEHPDPEEYAARHPEAAPLLRRVLASLAILDFSGPSALAAGGEGEEPPSGILGDFRIIREVGRGGMGVVYEAEQISLARRVALKVLPFAATMDPKHLQRFHNEARAAASLEHPHIVPVHAVGCERAVHFYAMKFIDGVTLAQAIAEMSKKTVTAESHSSPLSPVLRGEGMGVRGSSEDSPRGDPTADFQSPPNTTAALAAASTLAGSRDKSFYRRIAEWGIQAAEALEHAHGVGIVHRDVKPANLMVDGRSKLWVTDFGLAQVQSEASLTMTGDLIGTIRYMSPEQALANRVPLDQRTDVYSLGATLYELLTLEPAFAGDDRQKLLRQIAFDEPRSPRRIDRSIPEELETIVLKAMEKDPADRYATAQALADDLRRYLKNEPIHARRSSLMKRARKIVRRHPGVTATAAAAIVAGLLLGIAGLAISNRMIRQEQRRTQKALNSAEQEKAIARAVRDVLRNLLIQADPRAQASALRKVGGKSTARDPNPRIRELLDRAALDLAPERIEGQFPDQPLVQAELLRTIGEAYAGIGECQSAISHLERARDLHLHELGPTDPDTLTTMNSLGRAYLDAGKAQQAAELFQVVCDRRRDTLGPDNPDTLTSMNDLARCYFKLRKHDDALKLREKIVHLRKLTLGPDHLDTLASMLNLADSYAASKHYSDALQLHQQVLEKRTAKLGENDPDTLQSMNNVGNCYGKLGKYEKALEFHQGALDRRSSILGVDHPDTLRSMNNAAVACEALGKYEEALKLYEETLDRRMRKLHAEHRDTQQSINALAWLLANSPDRKLRDPKRALELAQQAVKLAPNVGPFQNTLGTAFYRMGDWNAAIAALTKSMKLHKGGDSADYFFLAMAHCRLGNKDESRKWYGRAVLWMEKNKPGDDELRCFRAEAAELLGIENKWF